MALHCIQQFAEQLNKPLVIDTAASLQSVTAVVGRTQTTEAHKIWCLSIATHSTGPSVNSVCIGRYDDR